MTATGLEEAGAFKREIDIGGSIRLYVEVKTLSPNAFARNEILDGFKQAMNTAQIHKFDNDAVSILIVDKTAWDYAYANGGKPAMDMKLAEFRNMGGLLFLPEGLTSDTKNMRLQIYDKVKYGTTNEAIPSK